MYQFVQLFHFTIAFIRTVMNTDEQHVKKMSETWLRHDLNDGQLFPFIFEFLTNKANKIQLPLFEIDCSDNNAYRKLQDKLNQN